jgi:hypothetical protein
MLERSEGVANWSKHHTQEIQRIRPHVSGRSSDQSIHLGHLSPLDSSYRSRSQKNTTPPSVDLVGKLCIYVGTKQRICLSSDYFCSDSTVILTTIAMKQWTDMGARPHVCGVFFNDFKVCFNFRRWFMLCLVYISHIVLVLMSGDRY